ncbi:MAG: zinc ribbon domain-containing protein, partial [Ktedonobacteraceae bacterium]|nr:zinc ribbon domain-containing protein [Ktedonobacteraceae bacterium]
MAQVSPQYCPQCGTEVIPQQKFCATCGLPRAALDGGKTESPSSGTPALAGSPEPLVSRSQAQNVATLDHMALPPNHKRKIGRNGIILLLVALLLVIIAAGYGVLQALGVGRPTQAHISRTNINTTVTYASVAMTILNVQQAQNFLDDPNSASDGMIRVQMQAKNTLRQPVNPSYITIAHLLQPDGKEVAAVYASSNAAIAPGATQTSNIDFPLPLSIKSDQLRLRLGAASEEQLDIPLNSSADLSKYAPK